MIKDLVYFDSLVHTALKVPLPLNDKEKIKIFYTDVYFRFESKNSRESINSISGTLYLTTHRVIYIPDDPNASFSSFFVPINKIFTVESDYYIECLCEHSYVSIIYLSFKNNYNKTFFDELKTLLENVELDIDETYLELENKPVILFSDVSDLE